MKLYLAVVLFSFLYNAAICQLAPKSQIIIGEWYSTNTYHKKPFRKLIFKTDSTFEETVNNSLGSITSLSKYYFVGDQIVFIEASTKYYGEIIFYNNNKFKFSGFADSLKDRMYGLTFKRKK